MQDDRKITIYLDQNLVSHLRAGQPAREELLGELEILRKHGAIFVYSHVHVEECRAFHDPEQFAQVFDQIDGYYGEPILSEQKYKLRSGLAKDLILSETDFVSKCLSMINKLTVLMQFSLGWLGDLQAIELKQEFESEIDLWVKDFERETLGIIDTTSIREQLVAPILSLDLNKLKGESLDKRRQTEREQNEMYSKIDNLAPDQVVNFIFRDLGENEAQALNINYPKNTWPEGTYRETGTLTGLTFLLFIQGVGRDSGVKKGSQYSRRRRLLAQFRDCQHIEEAARCDVFISNDSGAIKLARAAYAHAGVSTLVKHVHIQVER